MVQDLMAERHIYQWAGIGFGEQETYRLQKSLKKLSADKAAKSLRFFGKVYGTQRDYYIVEAEVEGGDEEQPELAEGETPVEKDAGVNKFAYFVSHNSLSEWTKLPDLSLNDLLAARKIKVMFTGDLERPIYTNPFFFGQEKHYLRA
jgi:radial spoke head protein 4/6